MHSTINSFSHETFSLLINRRYDKLPAIPVLSRVNDSHVPQKLSIDLSPLIFEPCQICLRGLKWDRAKRESISLISFVFYFRSFWNAALKLSVCRHTRRYHASRRVRWSCTVAEIGATFHRWYRINLSTIETSFHLWYLLLVHPNGRN